MTTGAGWARLYHGASVIDCDSPDVLDEILTTSNLGEAVVRRLSDRTVVVDDHQKVLIVRALARRGQPYRLIDLAAAAPRWPAGDSRR